MRVYARQIATWCAAAYMIVMAGYLATRPDYAWDMMAYMAVALHDLGMPLDQTHDAVYGYLERTLPAANWDILIGRPSPAAINESAANPTLALADLDFRQQVARDNASFLAQLPFFSVKPLFPALLAVVHATGLGLITSGMIVSALCYIGIGLIFYFWFTEWMPPFVALGVMALLVINPYLVLMARNIGPDMLSDFVLLFAVFLIMHDRPLASVVLLLIAIAARPENILYAGVFICYLGVVRLLSPLKVLACLAATALLYLVLVRTSGNYGWTSLLYYTFVTKSATPGAATPVLGAFAIINMYLGRLDRILLGQGELPIFMLIGFGALCLKSGIKRRYQDLLQDRYAHLLGLCALLAVVRMAILPVEAFRALLPCYMLLTVVLIETCASMQRRLGAI